jgi:hypothetical protein
MRNNLDFDYHKMTYPNLLKQVDKGVGADALSFGVEPMLLTLLERVARKNPRWEIIIETPKHSLVYEDKELIGKVQLSSNWNVSLGSHTVYDISGPRVGKELERKNSRHTVQINRAMQLIKKLFGAQTPREITATAMPAALNALEALVRGKVNDRNYVENSILNNLQPLLKTHWALVRDVAIKGGMAPELVASYKDKDSKAVSMRVLKTQIDERGKAALVIAHKDGYLVADVGDAHPPPVYVDDTHDASILTPTMRKNIGMLKLVKDNEAVTGVGFRAESGVFIVLKEDAEYADEN